MHQSLDILRYSVKDDGYHYLGPVTLLGLINSCQVTGGGGLISLYAVLVSLGWVLLRAYS